MLHDEKHRMAFGDYVDKFFAVMLIGICGFGVAKISEMQTDLKDLNKNLAVTISNVANQKEDIEELKSANKEIKTKTESLQKRLYILEARK